MVNSQVKSTAGSLAVITVAAVGVMLITNTALLPAPPAPRTITLIWDNAPGNPTNTVTEVWASTNLTTWTLKTNIAGTNRVTLPATNRAEFFKVRNKIQLGTNTLVTDWARK